MPRMARARSVLGRCRGGIASFFVSFSCTVSHEKRNGNSNGNKTTISNVAFVIILMLSVSLCGTLKWFAVHENEMEKVLW